MVKELSPAPKGDLVQETTGGEGGGGGGTCIFLSLASHIQSLFRLCWAKPSPCLPETPVRTRLLTLQKVQSSDIPGSSAAMAPAQTENVSVDRYILDCVGVNVCRDSL